MYRRVNPEEATSDWRAVYGRTACTVRRAGRARALSDPYAPQFEKSDGGLSLARVSSF